MSEVVLRDLQSVLRRQIGEEIIVENYETKSLLPPGENYGSTLFSVIASIKKNKNARAETLHLVAKMLPPTTFQREVFDSKFTFKKEIFLYTDIIPCYRELEKEFGVDKNETFDIVAKFYGSRLSANPDVDFDDDAVILLENLKVRGYYVGDRKTGLDLSHARIAIRAMARFHALGIAVKYKRPNDFEVLKLRCECLKFNSEAMQGMKNSILKNFREDPELKKSFDKCAPVLERDPPNWTSIPSEPWSTIIHSDFWVNNMMFHKDSKDKVDDIKFVDFQNYLFQNPIMELIFFICSSVRTDLVSKNMDSLLDLYYENFVSVLKRMDCDTTLFNKDQFDERVKKDAHAEFSHSICMLKVLTIDVEKDGVDKDKLYVLDFQTVNDNFYDRIRKIVKLYIERDWI